MVGDCGDNPPGDVWFSYYKDLRPDGGRLKLGYGPGGPPVLDGESVVELMAHMLEHDCIDPGIVRTRLAAALTVRRITGSFALSPLRPGGPCARRMIPLESPVPKIGTPGSVSGGLETRPWEPD